MNNSTERAVCDPVPQDIVYGDDDENARDEIVKGCEVAKAVEQLLNQAMEGVPFGPSLRSTLLRLSSQIAATFHTATMLLHSHSNRIGSTEAQNPLSTIAAPSHSASPPSSSSYICQNSPPIIMNSVELHSTEPPHKARRTQSEAAVVVQHNSRKRKRLMPKITLKIPSTNQDQAGNDMPPNDGHTWRKYGQKVIHGANHQRAYYHCTHKNDMGCEAKKQVQKIDDNPKTFQVTYQGAHTCIPPEQNDPFWPFAFPLTIPLLTPQQLQALQSFNAGGCFPDSSAQLTFPFPQFPLISNSLAASRAANNISSLQPSFTNFNFSKDPANDDANFAAANCFSEPKANSSNHLSDSAPRCTTAETSGNSSQNTSSAKSFEISFQNSGIERAEKTLYGSLFSDDFCSTEVERFLAVANAMNFEF